MEVRTRICVRKSWNLLSLNLQAILQLDALLAWIRTAENVGA